MHAPKHLCVAPQSLTLTLTPSRLHFEGLRLALDASIAERSVCGSWQLGRQAIMRTRWGGWMESADREIEVRPGLLDGLARIEAAVRHWRDHMQALVVWAA